jgi:hypothetical protein
MACNGMEWIGLARHRSRPAQERRAHPPPPRPPHFTPPRPAPALSGLAPQVIFGQGAASIGLHYDRDNVVAKGTREPVATYLSICAGAKLVLLLPPGQKLLPAGGDANALLDPSPELLAAVRDAGGHFFLLENVPDAAATGGGGGGGGGFSATALYMPAGTWHWVVGLTDWHVVFGGSYYPDHPVEP